MRSSKIIFFGPRIQSVFGKFTVGGGTVLFENLINIVQNKHHIININGDSKWKLKKIIFNLVLIFKYLFYVKRRFIFFVAHRQAILFLTLDFFLRKKNTYRLIGGNFTYWFNNTLFKKMLQINSDNIKIFCELPSDVIFFKNLNIDAEIQENFRNKKSDNKNSDLNPNEIKKTTAGFFGRIKEDKGIREFLEIAKNFPNFNFLIAGPFHSKIEENLVNKLLQEIKNMKYLGIVSFAEANLFYDNIDILFFHSSHKGEGKPGVLVESLLNNIPIITNYRVNCSNWDVFYTKMNIILCDGRIEKYYECIRHIELNKIVFSKNDFQVFNSTFCLNQLLKINA
jgi:glycosyltransferase involved in cell wall biosynthesis